jgi:putative ABC transport system permease protein
MAALVTARRREIGVRMALGARRTQVVTWILRHGAGLTVLGLGLGLLGAMASSRWLESLLFGVSPTEPAVLGGVAALLAAVALSAAWLPARRAARIDPAEVLRSE